MSEPYLCLVCRRGRGREEMRLRHNDQPSTKSCTGRSQTCKELHFLWHQPCCIAGDRDGFASQFIKAQLLSRAYQWVSRGTILPAGPAAPAALKEGAASLKEHFFYLQTVDDLEALKPESWWTFSFNSAELQILFWITSKPDLCLKLACMLYLPNGCWLSQVTEIICCSSQYPVCVSSASSASRAAWQWLPSLTSAVRKAGRELITEGEQCQAEESRLPPLLLQPRRMRNMLLPSGSRRKKKPQRSREQSQYNICEYCPPPLVGRHTSTWAQPCEATLHQLFCGLLSHERN